MSIVDPMRHVTLRQVQIFLVAAEYLSFVRTAKALHLTQPAVSMQMSQLGEALGAPLFEKHGRKVILSQAGQTFLPYAQEIAQVLSRAGEAMLGLKNQPRGKVQLALVTTSRYFAPRLLAQFRTQYPGIELEVSIANRENVIGKLEQGQIDLAVMGRPPMRLAVEAHPFAKHPHVIIAAPSHALAGQKRISPKKLETCPFLVREPGSGTRLALDQYLSESGIRLQHLQEMTSNESIKQAVMAGMGLALISQHTIGLECQTGHLAVLDIKGLPVVRTWYVVHLADRSLSPAAQLFQQYMQEQAPAMIDMQFPGARLGL
ncbi:MAG: LysR family transcriptional regulator [bacterium]|jgi:DNA-binding transcriptional LysR family regulator